MKINPSSSGMLAAALLLLSAVASFAQGSLTPPPGPPGPLMKTLDQIEPRTVLGTPGKPTTSTVVIDAPGSYVLAGPITVTSGNGVEIKTNNVSLDLNGFTISSTSTTAGSFGIGSTNDSYTVAVFNGFVGKGFTNGVALSSSRSESFVHHIIVQGAKNLGIHAGSVSDCEVLDSLYGIRAMRVQSCTVMDFRNGGIDADLVESCYVTGIPRPNAVGIFGFVSRNCTVFLLTADTVPIVANIAIGCLTQGGANEIDHAYLMP